MSIRMLRRFIAEACSGMVRNGLMTIASLFVVTSCLFIFGVFMVITMNINYIGEQLANECQIQAYITSEAKYGGKIQGISDRIKQIEGINEVSFETGEATFANFKSGLSKSELAAFEGLPENIISDSFKVTLTDINLSEAVVAKLEAIEGVERVENKQDIMNIVNNVTQIIRHVSIWIVIIFAIISLFIISNTIKLTVHSRGREINIMKYVGATDAYIRWPFIIEGILVGCASAVVSFFITQGAYMGVLSAVEGNTALSALLNLRTFSEIWNQILLSYLLLGAFIGAFGSAISVRRYLKV
ncbi:MAG: permease-like cell division protein FtsX [Clostridia bacterium]|nr:permease-like cell division protein FtsX [Clostridia bacterium]